MTVHICRSVSERCWNPYDSYGEICVGCGCCSPDPVERATARLEVSKQRLDNELHFDNWMEGCEELQRKIRASNIRFFKRRIRYYTKRLKELGVKINDPD